MGQSGQEFWLKKWRKNHQSSSAETKTFIQKAIMASKASIGHTTVRETFKETYDLSKKKNILNKLNKNPTILTLRFIKKLEGLDAYIA